MAEEAKAQPGEGMETAWTQPNPGWGEICVGCRHRQHPPESDFPCKKWLFANSGVSVMVDRSWALPVLERKTPGGLDIGRGARLGRDFIETCDKFEAPGQAQAKEQPEQPAGCSGLALSMMGKVAVGWDGLGLHVALGSERDYYTLRQFLRGLGITLEDCARALSDEMGPSSVAEACARAIGDV